MKFHGKYYCLFLLIVLFFFIFTYLKVKKHELKIILNEPILPNNDK